MRQNKKEVKKMKISEADLFEKIEAFLADYPICQYGFLKSEDILFSDKVRYICEKECPRYGKSWSCPPAVGEVADCKKHCISYQYALVFTTLSEVKDIDDMEEFIKNHEIKIAALTLPQDQAPKIAKDLVSWGIKGFWNFAPVDLTLPDSVTVENVHLAESLMTLTYNIHSREDSEGAE